jgi:hypothetical protein
MKGFLKASDAVYQRTKITGFSPARPTLPLPQTPVFAADGYRAAALPVPGAKRQFLRAILPHEWIFGTYLLLTGLRLLAHGGTAQYWSLMFFGCLTAGTALSFWAEQKPTGLRWRIRLLFYPAAMGISFYAMGKAIPLLGIPPADGLLLQWDRALLGHTPSVTLEPFLRPWAEDVAMGGYLFFFYYLIAAPGHYCIHDLQQFCKCIVGLFTLYGLAFMGYTVLPAAGPHVYLPFKTPLHGTWLLDRVIGPVNAGSNGLDAFPSIHVAASLYLLLFDWQHWRRRFWWFLLPCIVLWISTIYLRFHYFVDLLAAVVPAAAGWAMAVLYGRQSCSSIELEAKNGSLTSRPECHKDVNIAV